MAPCDDVFDLRSSRMRHSRQEMLDTERTIPVRAPVFTPQAVDAAEGKLIPQHGLKDFQSLYPRGPCLRWCDSAEYSNTVIVYSLAPRASRAADSILARSESIFSSSSSSWRSAIS